MRRKADGLVWGRKRACRVGTRPLAEKLVPLVDPKRTIKPDYIIPLDDGKRYNID